MTHDRIPRALARRTTRLAAAVVLVLACLAVLAACDDDDGARSVSSEATTTTTTTTQTVTAWFAGDDGRLVAEQRTVDDAPDPLTAAMRAVAAGPETPGLLPALPAGTTVRSAEQAGSVALVDLSREFADDFPGVGSADQIATLSPLVWTATEVAGVDEVLLTVDGAVPEIPGLQFDLSAPLTREDLPVEAGEAMP
jgi:spore germination protein GerM